MAAVYSCPWKSTSFEVASEAMVVIVYVSFAIVGGISAVAVMGEASSIRTVIREVPVSSNAILLKVFEKDSFSWRIVSDSFVNQCILAFFDHVGFLLV